MSYQSDRLEVRILDVARGLFERAGSGFTMEQLEAEARTSRATIYRRFGSKRALLQRLAAERGTTFAETDVRRDILRAARTVFGREGLAAATVGQIAAEAGVGVATIYRHFGDKETLVLEYIERLTPRSVVNERTLHPTEDVRGDLEVFLGAVLPLFFENRDVFRLALSANRSDRRYLEGLRKRSDSTLSRITDYFRVQVAAGRLDDRARPDEMALALMGMVLSFAVFGPTNYGSELDDPRATGQVIVALFLDRLLTDEREVGGA